MISNLLGQVLSGSGRGKLLSEIILLLTEMTVFHSTHKYFVLCNKVNMILLCLIKMNIDHDDC